MASRSLERHHRKLVAWTATITEISGDSVLGIGQALADVLTGALTLEQRTAALQIQPPAGMTLDVSELGGALIERIDRATELTGRVRNRVGKVGQACERLTEINAMCQILLMHTRIESDRIRKVDTVLTTGEQLARFIGHMVEATQQAESVQHDLHELIEGQSELLSKMRRLVETLHFEAERRLSHREAQRVRHRELFERAVQVIRDVVRAMVVQSQHGVSALQFQDPAIQGLQRLDSKMADLQAGTATAAHVRWGRRLGDTTFDVDPHDWATIHANARELQTDIRNRADGFRRNAKSAVETLETVMAELVRLMDQLADAGQAAIQHASTPDDVTPYLRNQLSDLDRLTSRYGASASESQTLCASLVEVQSRMQRVARKVETPAQNLSLHASMAGHEGRALGVIADEMVAISREVITAGHELVEAANVLLQLLPELKDGALHIAATTATHAAETELAAAFEKEATSARHRELNVAMVSVRELVRTVSAAQQAARNHYGFAESVAPFLDEISSIGDSLIDDLIELGGPPPETLPPRPEPKPEASSVESDDNEELAWMFETEEHAEVDVGELILL
ncbi:MAG: hypothetical protein AAGA48_02270 [Myxococcota bacterium]